MNAPFRAIYHDQTGQRYEAGIFISSVTITVRINRSGQVEDINWLGQEIVSLDTTAVPAKMVHRSGAYLTINDETLLQSIRKSFRHQPFVGGKLKTVASRPGNRLLIFLFSILAFLVLAYLFIVPWIGERVAMSFSKDWEVSLGNQMYQGIRQQYKIDSNQTVLINRFLQVTGFKLHYPVQVTVVKEKELNAFAIPGGNIVVFDEIIQKMNNAGQLAALLAHESAHIEKRHSLRNMFRVFSRRIFLMMIIGNDSGISSFLASQVDNLKNLEYSRSLETEADSYGISLLRENHINPTGMKQLMELLESATKGKEPSEFLNTHPVFRDRIRNIEEQGGLYEIDAEKMQELESLLTQLKKGTDW